ncbi:MAG: rod shape-determining protein MreD, partial [Pseudomonadota bacterium]|nr:rod shape-determining protein MreD [Pseudomonadota bacterium]
MRQPLAQRLDGWARGLMPALSVLFLVLMSAVPSGLPNFAGTSPCYSIIGVFYWSVFRPDLLP